jgi:hypothetical protein
MASQWKCNKLEGAPQRIRPETHWFQETRPGQRVSGEEYGRVDGNLWFSLQFKQAHAEQFYQSLGKLIEAGARMAPTSHKALKYALDLAKFDTIGTDIYVPKEVFSAFEKLCEKGAIEITDAGLAVEGEVKDCPEFKVCCRSDEEAMSIPGPIPKGSPVIIATIDDGIGIANHRFREAETRTRIKHFLDLALIGKPAEELTGWWVDELLGRTWKGSDIDKLLGRDEEQVYRALGLIDPLRDLRQPLRAALSHGTHVLDLAAGYDWRTEAAKELANRPIIAVQLPSQVAENLSDTWLAQCLKRALDWILVKADELSDQLSPECDPVSKKKRRLPLIVNGSFASMAGPQDGASDVERRITQFVKTYRGNGPDDLCTLVLSAGNSLQLRDAARMDIVGCGVGEISWRLQPDDKTPNFVQIWLPEFNAKTQQVEVSLVPPLGDASTKPLDSKLDKAVEWRIGGRVGARIYHQHFRRSGGWRECITIATRPTGDDQKSEPVVVVPSGRWQIKIKSIGKREIRNIDLQIHRNDVGIFSRSGARQSYFDDPRYVMFDEGSGRIINNEEQDRTCGTRVTRQGTLSSYAYAKGALVVGGYRLSDGQPATYSSSGRRPGNPALAGSASASDDHDRTEDAAGNPLDGPDFAAVSERSPAVPGILAAGTYSGSFAILSGTSVAAPQLTRALADQIAKRATGLKASIAGQAPKTAGAAEELRAAVVAKEETKRKEEETANPAAQRLRSLYRQFSPPRPWRAGVGRLSFKSLYPKRIAD